MTMLRPSPSTTTLADALKADIDRVARALAGSTTPEALAQARAILKGLPLKSKSLDLALGGEIATAKERERLDRPAAKAPAVPMNTACGWRGRGCI